MSQTTRCPSCGTLFKVVADQLRISDGWVRCGQCQLVFDASAHLQAHAPAPLLPDMALDRLRPPPAPVRRTEPVDRVWGAAEGALTSILPKAPAAPLRAEPVTSAPPSGPEVSAPDLAPPHRVPLTSPAAVLQVPDPVVPAFLVQGSGAEDGAPAEAVLPVQAPSFGDTESSVDAGATMDWPRIELPSPAKAGDGAPAPVNESQEVPLVPPAGLGAPALELLPKDRGSDFSPLRPPSQASGSIAVDPEPHGFKDRDGTASAPPAARGADAQAREVDAQGPLQTPAPAKADVAGATGSSTVLPEDPEDAAEPGVQELSFMRAAQRKAFWRKPWVRVLLSMASLALLALLALQVAVLERDELAARIPALKPGLQAVCARMGCVLAARRDIAAVEVDSSSFQKLRGDEYQLSLVLKNRSSLAVAMPALELTLTDAADQPVLRRVLLPEHWNAPQELAARGEWSVSRALVLTPSGARITGYRVIAFYP